MNCDKCGKKMDDNPQPDWHPYCGKCCEEARIKVKKARLEEERDED